MVEDEWYRLLRSLSVAVPWLSRDTVANSLVCITGFINSIEEQAVYYRSTCNTCGNKNLKNNSQPNFDHSGNKPTPCHSPTKPYYRQSVKLYCHHCKIHITSPDTGLELTVSMQGEGIPANSTATVQILQSTVASLLADISIEEGCDVHAIVGKPLPTMTCFILSTAIQSTGCKHFVAKQILLNN